MGLPSSAFWHLTRRKNLGGMVSSSSALFMLFLIFNWFNTISLNHWKGYWITFPMMYHPFWLNGNASVYVLPNIILIDNSTKISFHHYAPLDDVCSLYIMHLIISERNLELSVPYNWGNKKNPRWPPNIAFLVSENIINGTLFISLPKLFAEIWQKIDKRGSCGGHLGFMQIIAARGKIELGTISKIV